MGQHMHDTVMIVDDNKNIRNTVEMICQLEGLNVVCSESGEQCLRNLSSGFRGVILMDIMMPDLNGWDTIREIVAQGFYAGNLILMLTGIGEPDAEMDGLQEYVTDYLAKPFRSAHLTEALHYYLALLKTRRSNGA